MPDEEVVSPPEGEPTPEAPEAPEETQGQAPDEEELEELPQGQQVFPRAYVEKLRQGAASYRTRHKEVASQLEEWGGTDTVSQAMNLWQAAQTPDGLGRIFIEAGQNLGISPDRLYALINGGPSPKTPKGAEVDEDSLDEPLTRRELQELLEREVRGPLAQQQQELVFARNQAAVNSVLKELGVTDAKEANIVLELGDRYVSPDETRAEALVAAVRKGHADFVKILDSRGQEYVRRKAATSKKSPGALLGGSPASTELPPEPKNLDEAHQRLRQRLAAAGLE